MDIVSLNNNLVVAALQNMQILTFCKHTLKKHSRKRQEIWRFLLTNGVMMGHTADNKFKLKMCFFCFVTVFVFLSEPL